MPIDTLFLDAGGVLVVPNWQRVSDTLARRGIVVSAGALGAADPHARRALDLGAADATDQQRGWLYFNLVLRHAGVPLSEATDRALADLQAYHDEWNLWEQVPDGVVTGLERLRSIGLKLVVVSNANGKLKPLLRRLGLADRVDVMLDSHEEGVEKPDPRLFDLALDRSSAARDRTMHVGDLYSVDVVGARAAGLRAVLFDPQDLYEGFDCPRVRSLEELAERLVAGTESS
jgi:putative hydrolase of the HAD superfamily